MESTSCRSLHWLHGPVRFSCTGALIWIGLVAMLADTSLLAQQPQEKINYDDHIRPIFRNRCFACHQPDKKSGDLDLTTYTSLMQGGSSGDVIEPGDPDSSYLYALVAHQDEPAMPPESDPIPESELKLVHRWIALGALENRGSKPAAAAKNPIPEAASTNPLKRPDVVPMPARLSLKTIAPTQHKASATALATSPWAPLVAIGAPKQVLLYHTQHRQLVGVLPFPEGVPNVLKFSRNGSLLLAGGGRGGANGRAVVWRIDNGQRVTEVGDELDTVLAADISADQTLIALGGPQRVVRVYSTATGELKYELRKHTDWIQAIEFSPDGVLLASGDRNGGLMVWEAHTGRDYLTLKGHRGGISDVSWRSDSNVCASSSEDRSVKIWEMENGRQLKSWNAHNGGTLGVQWTRDGRLVTCGRDRITKLWDINGKPLRVFPAMNDLATSVSYCDETDQVIAGDWRGEIRLWRGADGNQTGQLNNNPPTLTQRLATAQTQLREVQATHQAATEKVKLANQQHQKQQEALQSVEKEIAQARQSEQQARQRLQNESAQVTQLKADINQAQQRLQQWNGAQQALKQATDQLAQAQSILKNDAELKQMIEHLQKWVGEQSGAAEKDQQFIKQSENQLSLANEKVSQMGEQVTQAESAHSDCQNRLERITAELQQLAEQLAQYKTQAQTAHQAVGQAQQEVSRWQDELEFANQSTGATSSSSAPPTPSGNSQPGSNHP